MTASILKRLKQDPNTWKVSKECDLLWQNTACKCCFVAWEMGLPWKFACCVLSLKNSGHFKPLFVRIKPACFWYCSVLSSQVTYRYWRLVHKVIGHASKWAIICTVWLGWWVYIVLMTERRKSAMGKPEHQRFLQLDWQLWWQTLFCCAVY